MIINNYIYVLIGNTFDTIIGYNIHREPLIYYAESIGLLDYRIEKVNRVE